MVQIQSLKKGKTMSSCQFFCTRSSWTLVSARTPGGIFRGVPFKQEILDTTRDVARTHSSEAISCTKNVCHIYKPKAERAVLH